MTLNDYQALSAPQRAALIAGYRTPATLNHRHFAWQTLDYLQRRGWIHRQWPDKRFSLDSEIYVFLKELDHQRLLI